MRSVRPALFAACVVVAVLASAGVAVAQTNAVEQRLVPYSLSSGDLTNLAPAETVVFSRVVEAPDAEWLRLTFRRVELGIDSYLRLTSLEDGAVQTLKQVHLLQWKNSSAYFNGSAVRVELVAGPQTAANLVEVGDLYAGLIPREPLTICGPTDDRTSSSEPERARLLNVGCTAWMFSEDSCFASAGHCVANSGLLNVVQFNVPPSNANGSLNHPGPEDQYAPDTSNVPFVNGGVGNDWGLFRVFPNSVTGLLPFEVQGAHLTIATTNPPVGDDINVVGYGVDDGVDNQTQQISVGPLTLSNVTTLRYRSDTTGGNSGSGVVYPTTGEAVAIHTHGGCTSTGGSNAGTAVTNAGLVAALANFCPADPGGIPCGDIQRFQSRCRNNRLDVRAVFTDTSHDGETITVDVEGRVRTIEISGRTAKLRTRNIPSGVYTVELTDPAGCVPPVEVTCE